MTRRARTPIAIALALITSFSSLIWTAADPPPAAAAFCIGDPDPQPPGCDAQWAGELMGTVTVSPTHPVAGDLVTITATPIFPQAAFTPVGTLGCAASGITRVDIWYGSVFGELVSVSPESSDDMPVSMGGGAISWHGGPEEIILPPNPREGGAACSDYGTPTSRIPAGEAFSITFRQAEGVVIQQVRATFVGVIGFVGWSDDALALMNYERENQPPTARIDVNQVSPGQFNFTAIASDPDGDPISLEWDFGDDTTDVRTFVPHTYELPGSYIVTLRVSDGEHETVVTEPIEVAAPTATVAIRRIDRDDDVIDIDGTADFELIVAVDEDGVGPLDLDFNGVPLAMTGPITLQSGPEPPIVDLLLQPGDARSFVYRVGATGIGPFRLSTALVGDDAAGRAILPVSAAFSGDVGVPLEVEVNVNPNELALELADGVDDHHYDPKTTTVTVTVRNTIEVAISDLRLIGLEAGLNLAVKPGRGAPSPFPLRVVGPPLDAGGEPLPLSDSDVVLGTLAAGEEVSVTYTVEASNGGEFDISTVARGGLPGGQSTSRRGVSGLRVLTDVALVVDLEINTTLGSQPRIDEGQTYTIFGRLENVTAEETIVMAPVRIGLAGNGMPFGPVDLTELTTLQDQVAAYATSDGGCPSWTYAPTIRPTDAASSFAAIVATEPIDLPLALEVRENSTTFVRIEAFVLDESGEPQPLDPERIRINYGNGAFENDDGEGLRVAVVPRLRQQPLLDPATAVGVYLARYSANIVTGAWRSIGKLLPTIGQLAAFGVLREVQQQIQPSFLHKVMLSSAYLGYVWDEMPRAERDALILQIASDLFPLQDEFETVEALVVVVDKAISDFFSGTLAWFDKRDALVDEGDMFELIEFTTEPAKTAGELAGDWLGGEAVVRGMCGLAKLAPRVLATANASRGGAEAAAAAARIEEAAAAQRAFGDPRAVGVAPEVWRILRGFEEITAEQAARIFGQDAVTHSNVLRMTDHANGGLPIVVAFRARAAETLAWLESRFGAALKPEGMYAKTTSLWDVLVLGYRRGPPGYGAGDIGSLVLAEPLPREIVEQRILSLGLDEAESAMAWATWERRMLEWNGKGGGVSEVQRMLQAATRRFTDDAGVEVLEGTFQVPARGSFRLEGNADTLAAVEAGIARTQMREVRFQLRRVADPPDNAIFRQAAGRDRAYYEVWLEAADGSMRRVTGDMDAVGAWNLNGARLNPSQAATAARNMAHQAGTRHGWSESANDLALRLKYVRDHVWNENPALRGEPMLLYANGKSLVGYFKKVFKPGEPAEFVTLEGAPLVLDSASVPNVIVPHVDVLDLRIPPGYVSPTSSLRYATGIDAGPGLPPTCPIQMIRSPQSSVLRRGDDGQVEAWTAADGWSPSSIGAECAAGARATVSVLPQSGLSDAVTAGATTLPIFAAEDVASGGDWFEVGDVVAINPGGATEELATVTGFGSLVLAEPTRYAHEPGEVVSVVPVAADAPSAPAPTTPPVTGGGGLPDTAMTLTVERGGHVGWTALTGMVATAVVMRVTSLRRRRRTRTPDAIPPRHRFRL